MNRARYQLPAKQGEIECLAVREPRIRLGSDDVKPSEEIQGPVDCLVPIHHEARDRRFRSGAVIVQIDENREDSHLPIKVVNLR